MRQDESSGKLREGDGKAENYSRVCALADERFAADRFAILGRIDDHEEKPR